MLDLGDPVPLTFNIVDAAGAPANATLVVLNITQPDQTVAGPFTLTSSPTGVYSYVFTPVQVGRHLARCVATGSNASAMSDAFDVAPADPGFIISLGDAKAHLRIVNQTTQDDELRLYLGAITDVVTAVCGPIVPRSFVEIREYADEIVLYRNPVQSVTSIAWTFTQTGNPTLPTYVLDGASGILRMQPMYPGAGFFPYGYGYAAGYQNVHGLPADYRLTVTYTAGYAAVPAGLQLAVRMILGELWDARRGAADDSGAVRTVDEELPIPSNDDILSTDAIQLLRPFKLKGPRVA